MNKIIACLVVIGILVGCLFLMVWDFHHSKPLTEVERGATNSNRFITIGDDPCTNTPMFVSNTIAIGYQACPTSNHQLVITWNDGTELRMGLPTNKWLRGK